MTTKSKVLSPGARCALVLLVGIATYGYANSEPLSDYVSNHFFNEGKTAMMEAEARETFKSARVHANKHDAIVATTTPRLVTK